MKQSRATSFLKSVVSTAVGFGVAFLANMIILPFFGLDISHGANFILTCLYTAISLTRGYILERAFEWMGWRVSMSAFALAVLAERQRQITVEGWSQEHDDAHEPGELASAGAAYAEHAARKHHNALSEVLPPDTWPWEWSWWKPQGFRRDLVKSAALILAEGERYDRNRKPKQRPFPLFAHGKSNSERSKSSRATAAEQTHD